ncbi:MAG: helix-turn-helix domain-containing protein [Actinobacteria bacterium]|nr:helix-turn-helix domain-containing protein [Actinomycetota bacterium]
MTLIRDQRSSASLSLRNLSGLTGVSIPYLSQIERGLRRPSADILQTIAKALRISAETLYVKAGILDERTDNSDPVGELLRDSAINEKQKRILIDLYQSFREAEAAGAHATKAAPVRAKARSVAARRPKPAPAKAKQPAGTKRPAAKKRAPAKKASQKAAKKRTGRR